MVCMDYTVCHYYKLVSATNTVDRLNVYTRIREDEA